MFDTHMHTSPFSTDAGMKLPELLKRKQETGLGIVLTEHMDYDFPPPLVYEFCTDDYFTTYSPYQNETFLLGIEIGLQSAVSEKNSALIRSCPFDMVIGSIHAVCGKDLYEKNYFEDFPDKKSAYSAYLETMYRCISEFDDFDALGHMDYICRKAPYEDPLLYYEEFREEIDRILKLLAVKEKSLEINTRLFGQKEAVRELAVICRRFVELGGRTVTIGSDAHHAAAIGSSLKPAYDLAFQCGAEPVVYKKRRPCPAV